MPFPARRNASACNAFLFKMKHKGAPELRVGMLSGESLGAVSSGDVYLYCESHGLGTGCSTTGTIEGKRYVPHSSNPAIVVSHVPAHLHIMLHDKIESRYLNIVDSFSVVVFLCNIMKNIVPVLFVVSCNLQAGRCQ
jgi:hypothetical protein